MCTAVSVKLKSHYFGRNLDYEHTFGEKLVITPQRYVFSFKNGKVLEKHYAIMGVALPMKGYPLYFDACNEKGLCMAGLNFPGNAIYNEKKRDMVNVASFEFVPWILCQCKNTQEAEIMLKKINITNEAFDDSLMPTPLHWIIADREKTLTIEQTESGIKIYNNYVGVLTNSPPFDFQMLNLSNFMNVSPDIIKNNFSDKIDLLPYSNGMGGIGLPGDLSSVSRFVRAAFTTLNSDFGDSESEIVNQFFHVLYSVYQQKGCVKTQGGLEMTNYSCCYNADEGICYYTTYYNTTINAIDIKKENIEGGDIIVYDMLKEGMFNIRN